MTRFLAIACAAILALVALVFGVGGCLERSGVQPEVKINPTTSYQVTQTPILYKTAQVTATPAPRYELTQQAIDLEAAALSAEREAHQRAIDEQRAAATSQAERDETEQRHRMYDAEYFGRVEALNLELEQARAAATFEADMHTAVISKTVQLSDNAVQNAELMARAWRGILTYAGVGVVTIVLCWLVFLSVRVMIEINASITAEPVEVEPEMVRLEVVDNQGKRSRFADLPVDDERFSQYAKAVMNGSSLSYDAWVTTTKRMTRTEYDKLTARLHELGILEYVNGQPNQGQRGTYAGKAALREWMATHDGM